MLCKKNCKKNCKKYLCILAAVILGLAVICALYLSDYYHTDTAAVAAFADDSNITVQYVRDNATAYIPDNPKAGFLFYPGGKVEHTAYEPLMQACAQQDILCVLIQMPGNLAVLDADAADGIQECFSEIDNWYIGGHSLGGSIAASYIENHLDAYRGLILLASYSTANLKDTGLDVLSVYGSEDYVLNIENYHKNKVNLPDAFAEVIISGGCHAYFGMYGAQAGDGIPTITNQEQILLTAEHIGQFVLSGY